MSGLVRMLKKKLLSLYNSGQMQEKNTINELLLKKEDPSIEKDLSLSTFVGFPHLVSPRF